MATAQTQEKQEWMLKEDAAKFLGTNTRSVERRARQGTVQKRCLPRLPHERQARVVYLRSDLEAILKGEARAPERELPGEGRTQTTALALMGTGGKMDPWRGLAAHLAHLSAAYTHPVTKAWLGLDEAAEYSGLPRRIIAELVSTSQIDSIGRGPKTWRIRRASLDAYGNPDRTPHAVGESKPSY